MRTGFDNAEKPLGEVVVNEDAIAGRTRSGNKKGLTVSRKPLDNLVEVNRIELSTS